MRERITIGGFIDSIKAKNFLEPTIFLLTWEETAPIFHGEDYRSKPLTKNFVTHLLNEMIVFANYWLSGINDRPRLFELALNAMNTTLKMVNTMADNHVEVGQTPQIAARG